MNIALIIIAVTFLLWIIWTISVVSGIEGPVYRIAEKKGGYEIREYESYNVAEVEVEGTLRSALRSGFRQLAGYIFGGNTSRTAIGVSSTLMETMRAPESIAMTVPVMESSGESGKRIIAFMMPKKYSLETLPKPNNAHIRFRTVDKSRKAVLRYSWYATSSRVEAKKKLLLEYLTRDGCTLKGEILSAQYNPPMSFPPFRRNEVMVDIE